MEDVVVLFCGEELQGHKLVAGRCYHLFFPMGKTSIPVD